MGGGGGKGCKEEGAGGRVIVYLLVGEDRRGHGVGGEHGYKVNCGRVVLSCQGEGGQGVEERHGPQAWNIPVTLQHVCTMYCLF